MIRIENKIDCCGCNACGDICPNGSISFEPDKEGFLYPIVNIDTCIDCHLCEKVCPVINVNLIKHNNCNEPACYALQHYNLDALFNSTSGSAFSVLADIMYNMGGYVGGAIFNDDYSVSQFISSDKKDLERIRNSKYVQSDSRGFYKQVKSLLNSGSKVLVCGLPCQMAALRLFLNAEFENLIIVDLICKSINSPKIFKCYLDDLENRFNSKIVYFKSKNKELGWRSLATKIVFANKSVLYDTKDTSYFTKGFLKTGVFARPSCYDCKFKGMPRISDITIGDLWGAEKIVGKEMDNDLGTSLVMINSTKGQNFFHQVNSKIKTKKIKYETAIDGNKSLFASQKKPQIDREQFYEDLNTLPFAEVAKKYIQGKRAITAKEKLKNLLRFMLHMKNACGINIILLIKNIYFNLFKRQINANILDGRFIVLHKHCVVQISKSANVNIGGIFVFGYKRIKGSKLESRLLVESGSELNILGRASIGYGSDIELFSNASLIIGADFTANINLTIVCGQKIVIDEHVCIGRNVTIRDNSGDHFISRRTFKNKRAVFIGQHSWLCEGCLIMPGTNLGTGVIVGAHSVVSGRFSNFTMLSGFPAGVVDEDVYWKA